MNKEIQTIVYRLAEQFKKKHNLLSIMSIGHAYSRHFAEALAKEIEDAGIPGKTRVVDDNDLRVSAGDEFIGQGALDLVPSTGWNLWVVESLYHSKLPYFVNEEGISRYSKIGYHAWVEHNGLFYDAECPTGVDNLFCLPFYQRYFKQNQRVV